MKKFFPNDTRGVEVVSSLSLFFTGAFMIVGPCDVPLHLLKHNVAEFWGILLMVFGFVQGILATALYRDESTRSMIAWCIGTFWVWISLYDISNDISIHYISSFFLGVSNLYAFVINFLTTRKQWNS